MCIKSKEFNISTNIFGTGVCRQIAIHGSEHRQIQRGTVTITKQWSKYDIFFLSLSHLPD
jgi:hypothetical protein